MADHKELENIDEKSKLNEESDTAKIKFQPSKNGEAKIEMPDSSVGYQCGLTKEELMKYANDPFWVAMRRVLFVLFWLLWVAMLVGAVAIIIITPGCARPKEPEWYEQSPMYEVRVDEFQDGDNNQKADLAGMVKRLPYFEEISVSAVVLDKLFNKDQPTIMNPDVGSFDDFTELAKSLKLVVKVPVSHVDFSSAQKQADFVDVLKFWLDKGAAGFVFDEVELLPNTIDLKTLTGQWFEMVSNFSTEEFPRVTILSSYASLDEEEFCNNTNMVLNYAPTQLTKKFTPTQLVDLLSSTAVVNKTTSCRSNLVLSNGQIQPLINRFESEERDRLVLFSLLADTTPFFYFGDEYAKDDPDMPSNLDRGFTGTPRPMNWETVERMKSENTSFFNVFAEGAKLRKQESIRMGETSLKKLGDNVVAMTRIRKGNPGFVVVTNFAATAEKVDLTQLNDHVPETGQIEVTSSNSRSSGKVNFKELTVNGQETLVMQFVAKF